MLNEVQFFPFPAYNFLLCELYTPNNSQKTLLYLALTDHSRVIGFSFDSNEAAMEFWQNVERLISNPENISLSAPGRKRKSMKNKRVKAKPLPPKSQISLPCQFAHVTNVTIDDAPRYHSLRLFVNSVVEEEIWWSERMRMTKMMTRRLNGLKIA